MTDGKMHFIRQVDGKGRINVLNESLKVGEEFISEYVRATICTGKRKIEVCYRAKDQDVAVLIKEFDYDLNEGLNLAGTISGKLKMVYDVLTPNQQMRVTYGVSLSSYAGEC